MALVKFYRVDHTGINAHQGGLLYLSPPEIGQESEVVEMVASIPDRYDVWEREDGRAMAQPRPTVKGVSGYEMRYNKGCRLIELVDAEGRCELRVRVA